MKNIADCLFNFKNKSQPQFWKLSLLYSNYSKARPKQHFSFFQFSVELDPPRWFGFGEICVLVLKLSNIDVVMRGLRLK